MAEKTDARTSMAIDPKKNRIRIHKDTLRLLGFPEFIQLLISPKNNAIVVMGADRQTPGGQEIPVVFDKPSTAGTFDIYSKELITRIREQFTALDRDGLCRLVGSFMPEEKCVCFPLDAPRSPEDEHV